MLTTKQNLAFSLCILDCKYRNVSKNVCQVLETIALYVIIKYSWMTILCCCPHDKELCDNCIQRLGVKKGKSMRFQDVKIGDRVVHRVYGEGIVQGIRPFQGTFVAEVVFDNAMNGSDVKQRTIMIDFLDKSKFPSKPLYRSQPTIAYNGNTTIKNNFQYHVGDRVVHSYFGEGEVTTIRSSMYIGVRFKKNNQERFVQSKELSSMPIEVIHETEEYIEDESSALKVIPSNYANQSCYTTSAKRLLTYLKKQYSEEGFVSITSYQKNDGEIGVFVLPKKGIVVFKLIESVVPISAVCSPAFETLAITLNYQPLKKYYLDKFLQSRTMCEFIDDDNKMLRFPFRFVLLYQNISIDSKSDMEMVRKALKSRDIYFKNFTSPFADNEVFSHFEIYSKGFEKIPAELYGSILERVIPENATLISISPPTEKKAIGSANPMFHPITGQEREFSALCLDDSQIKAINDTKPGHYLTLANPGTGKSVLLVSKAYRIQSMQDQNNVLITCFNKNLAEHHSIFAEVSGLKTPYLHISTFHRLATDLLKQIDPTFMRDCVGDEENAFDVAIDRLYELIKLGKVQSNLNAIFIDEIQLFEPKWIDICYALLDKADGKNYYFEMFGDINQDVKTQRSKGTASWQRAKTLPSLAGRVKKLEKNYRNTDLIANYLTCMISEFNEYLNQHGIPNDTESSCLSSVTSKKGLLKTKVLVSSQTNAEPIVYLVNELVRKLHADYNDIAIIYPAKGYGKYYTPQQNVVNALEKNNIPFSFIHGDARTGSERRQTLFECDGIIMSTIDSCLGLDFKYVILCGIHYWDLIYDNQTNKTVHLNYKMLLFNEHAHLFNGNAYLYFSEIGKKIYSACSRAREGLFIFDDTEDKSPIKQIIRPSNGGSYYDEH